MLGLGSCSELDNLQNINGNLKSFEYIGSHGSAISQLLSSVADSNKFKKLWFKGCIGLVSLPALLLSFLSPLGLLNLSDVF